MKSIFKITIRSHKNKSIWTYKVAEGIKEAEEFHQELVQLLAMNKKNVYLPFEDITLKIEDISCEPYVRAGK